MLSQKYKKYEFFELPNNWKIEIYYGFIDDPRFPGNTEFLNVKTRTSGQLRKIRIIKDNILLEEKIENNPAFLSDKNKIYASWSIDGEEFERKINFDNKYIFKIEYWFSKNKQEPNRGIYFSKFHKLILYNYDREIISEIIEENPNYINPKIIDEIDGDILY